MARPKAAQTPKGARAKKDARESGRPTRAQQRRRRMAMGVGVVLVVAVLVGYFAYRAVADLPGTSMPDLGNAHIQSAGEPHLPYNSDPPTSGPHLPYLAPWGVHTEPIVKELQVHNLEDGGVVIQYNCPSGCPELVDQLKAIVEGYHDRVVLAPYPGMKTRIALTAWTRIDAFDDFNKARIERFIKAYRGIDHHRGVE
jgi:hypothetical protein